MLEKDNQNLVNNLRISLRSHVSHVSKKHSIRLTQFQKIHGLLTFAPCSRIDTVLYAHETRGGKVLECEQPRLQNNNDLATLTYPHDILFRCLFSCALISFALDGNADLIKVYIYGNKCFFIQNKKYRPCNDLKCSKNSFFSN